MVDITHRGLESLSRISVDAVVDSNVLAHDELPSLAIGESAHVRLELPPRGDRIAEGPLRIRLTPLHANAKSKHLDSRAAPYNVADGDIDFSIGRIAQQHDGERTGLTVPITLWNLTPDSVGDVTVSIYANEERVFYRSLALSVAEAATLDAELFLPTHNGAHGVTLQILAEAGRSKLRWTYEIVVGTHKSPARVQYADSGKTDIVIDACSG